MVVVFSIQAYGNDLKGFLFSATLYVPKERERKCERPQ